MKKIFLVFLICTLWFTFLHFYRNATRKKIFSYIKDLQNVEKLSLNDSDEAFGIFYDLVVTFTNGEIIELHSVKANLDIRNSLLWRVNDTYFICKDIIPKIK